MDYLMPRVLSKDQCIIQPDGTYVVVVSNPLVGNVLGLPVEGTLLPSDPHNLIKGLLTVEPSNGRLSLRALDNIGPWQRAVKNNGMLVWNGCYEIPCGF